MSKFTRNIRSSCTALVVWIRVWSTRPFANLYGWAVPTVLFAGICFALPPWVGLVLFAPLAVALTTKAIRAIRHIHSLELIEVVVRQGRYVVDTERDRMQRAFVLGSFSLTGTIVLGLVFRALFATFPSIVIPQNLMMYLSFMALLVVGFLLFYYLSLRFDKSVLRGLTSVVVTLPAFFIIVVVCCLLLSWALKILGAIGLAGEGRLKEGFSWIFDVQNMLASATDYFLQQDPIIIGASIVVAALLLLLYAYTVPQYWIRSVARWMRGISLVVAVFSGAVIIFAGTWIVDLQNWTASAQGQQAAAAIDPTIVGSQIDHFATYRGDDLIALIKAFVLPYIVGAFVANAVVGLRRGKAKQISDEILNSFASDGSVDETAMPLIKKRYLYYGGSLTLWDIALRSIGHDIALPCPFAPRTLTIQERLTGKLEENLSQAKEPKHRVRKRRKPIDSDPDSSSTNESDSSV